MTEEHIDPLDFPNHKIMGVAPLFPCLAIVSVAADSDEEKDSENLFGVPGFYDATNKNFIRLDGRVVSDDFRLKISDFIDNKFPAAKEG